MYAGGGSAFTVNKLLTVPGVILVTHLDA